VERSENIFFRMQNFVAVMHCRFAARRCFVECVLFNFPVFSASLQNLIRTMSFLAI